ncbi:cysteine desulfurase family protein [Angustibacter sp. McL0619]|uniref:cysteine desulfurase family protein n=1 Tax=Angustibacter sp. McL0619 TaxID=3415676 RepID=UPI003CF8F7FF
MLPQAIEAMVAELSVVGNPSSLHTAGRRARRVVEESREQLARAVGASPSEVVFTSGGTEADNLAVKGTYRARRAADPRRHRVLVSSIEHHAVMDAAQALVDDEGAEAVWLPVDAVGRLRLDALRAAIEQDPASVALVSVMWANNEVGTVQPVAEVVQIAHEHGIPVHSDSVQAVGKVPVDFARSGLDLMSVTGHKIGGPVGVGALVAVRGAELSPLVHGGGQERQVRSGTLDEPAIRAFAVAAGIAADELAGTRVRLTALREALVAGIRAQVPDFVVHGDPDPAGRLPGLLNLSFEGCDGDSLLYLLDAQGIECSTGSACQAGVPQPSHVLLAMGMPEAEVRSALRLSLGHTSTEADVAAVLAALPAAVARARGAGAVAAAGAGR